MQEKYIINDWSLFQVNVEVNGAEWNLIKPVEPYTLREQTDDVSRPSHHYVFTSLKPDKYYEVEAIAHNDIGPSTPNKPPFIFKTIAGMLYLCKNKMFLKK